VRPDSSIQWSAYPALLLAAAFAAGVLADRVTGGVGFAAWGTGVGLGAVAFGGFWWWGRRRLVSLAPLGRVGAVVLVGICIGGARHAVYENAAFGALGPLATETGDAPLSVVGVVADAPERSGPGLRFTVAVDSVGAYSTTVPVDGRVRVTLRAPPWADGPVSFPTVHQGDRVRVEGAVEPAPGQRNPGGFDYAAYLARRGTCCVMDVGAGENVTVDPDARGPFLDLVAGARRHVRGQIGRLVPSEDARAVLRALLLGDRSGITDDQRDRFARTGLMHLLAVSGLHVFLVGMVLYTLLRPVLMRFRLGWRVVETGRAVFTVVVLGLYMAITGGRPSVVRAVVMASLFIGGILFQRSSHPLNTLGVAALILLTMRPPALLDAGFQLSVGAVAAIVTIHPRLMEWVPDEWTERPLAEWAASATVASAAATLGTAPALLWHFGWVSVAGLVLNVPGIPCTGLALSAGLGAVVVGGFWPGVGAAFGSTADLFVRGLLVVARWGTEWLGWAGLQVPRPGPWVLGALVAASVALAQWPRPRHRWRAVACSLLFLVGGVWTTVLGRGGDPTLDVLFFDVGQGDAVLVTTPEGDRMLVDTGPRVPGGGAAAARSVLPYLEARGVQHLETIVITHPDDDHLGGLPFLLREVSIGRVLHSGQSAATELYRDSRRLLRRAGTASRAVGRGDAFRLGAAVRVQVLGPPARPARHGIEGENGRSVVLHLSYGRTDVLLPGDVEAAAERSLVRAYGKQLSARGVKVPHHGSASSSTGRFVEHVVPDGKTTATAVVSVGESNRFGMPSPEVVARWASRGARVRQTAREGAVWLRSNGRTLWPVRWR
jgi:competence protein ComEC